MLGDYKKMNRFELMDVDEAIKLGIIEQPYNNGIQVVIENLPDGTKMFIGDDGGEPEDQLLCRDWKWVVPALNKAFKDGQNSHKKHIYG